MTAEPSSIADLEAWIEARLQKAGTPGAAVVLERNGETLLSRGFGHRDVEAGLAPDAETVFGSGSITKSLTALAILLLEEDGRLSVDDPVITHLPELRLPGSQTAAITLHHLLTHSAGLPPLPTRHYAWLSQDDLEPFERAALERLPPRAPIRSFDELIAFLGEHDYALHAPPGQEFSYSNEGYNLLGAIVERISGQSLAAFVHDRILTPAGMNRSSLDLGFTLSLPNVTRLHVRRGGKVVTSANWFNPVCWAAAGGLRSTAADLARFFRMLAADGVIDGVRVASPESVRKMTTGYADRRIESWYGYGLTVCDLHGHTLVQHGGGHKGVSALAGFAADNGVICVVMTNLAESPAGEIWDACMRAALGLPLAPIKPASPVALPLAAVRAYAGHYISGEGSSFSVAVDDAGAVVVSSGARSAPATPTEGDALTYVSPLGEQTLRFVRIGGPDVSHAYVGGRLIGRRDGPAPGPGDLVAP
jgi:CubicO group peptidase (beta-lactamase class C family)